MKKKSSVIIMLITITFLNAQYVFAHSPWTWESKFIPVNIAPFFFAFSVFFEYVILSVLCKGIINKKKLLLLITTTWFITFSSEYVFSFLSADNFATWNFGAAYIFSIVFVTFVEFMLLESMILTAQKKFTKQIQVIIIICKILLTLVLYFVERYFCNGQYR